MSESRDTHKMTHCIPAEQRDLPAVVGQLPFDATITAVAWTPEAAGECFAVEHMTPGRSGPWSPLRPSDAVTRFALEGDLLVVTQLAEADQVTDSATVEISYEAQR